MSPALTPKLTQYRDRCKAIQWRRNKQLAHADLATLLHQHGAATGVPLSSPSRQEIEYALEALRDFMRTIEDYFGETPVAYTMFVSRDDGDALVSVLKQGLRYEELSRNQVLPFNDLANFDRNNA